MDAKKYIEKLNLEPHPEGGYFKQVYGNGNGETKAISTIYYMLTDANFSAFHRLHGMTEIWYFHAGEPLNIYVIDKQGELTVHHLYANGEMQVVIEPEQWFAAEIPTRKGFCLVGCAVAPAFTFNNFELANRQQLTADYPQHADLISRLTRE